jgi:hypothetical protein
LSIAGLDETEQANWSPGDKCGDSLGALGAISVYDETTLKVKETFDFGEEGFLVVSATNGVWNISDVTEDVGKLNAGEELTINVVVGLGMCHPNNVNCSDSNGNAPRVNIEIDYGDGSGSLYWDPHSDVNLWQHSYTKPHKKYELCIQGMN